MPDAVDIHQQPKRKQNQPRINIADTVLESRLPISEGGFQFQPQQTSPIFPSL